MRLEELQNGKPGGPVYSAASSQLNVQAPMFFLLKAITSENWPDFVSGLTNPASSRFRSELRKVGPRKPFTVRISHKGQLVVVPTKDGVSRDPTLRRTTLLEGDKKYQMTRAQSFTAGRLPGYIPPSFGKGNSAYAVGVVLLNPTPSSAVCNHIAIYTPGYSCSFARKNEDFDTLKEAQEAIRKHKNNGFWFDSIGQLADHEMRNKNNRLNEVLAYAAFQHDVFGIMIFDDNDENRLIAIIRALDLTLHLKKNGVKLPTNYEVPIYFYDGDERRRDAFQVASGTFRVFEKREQEELLNLSQAWKSVYDFIFRRDRKEFQRRIDEAPGLILRIYYGYDFHVNYPLDEMDERLADANAMVALSHAAAAAITVQPGDRQPAQKNYQRLDDIFSSFRKKAVRGDWEKAIILLKGIRDRGELNTKPKVYQLIYIVKSAIESRQFEFISAFLFSPWAQSVLSICKEDMKKLLVDIVEVTVIQIASERPDNLHLLKCTIRKLILVFSQVGVSGMPQGAPLASLEKLLLLVIRTESICDLSVAKEACDFVLEELKKQTQAPSDSFFSVDFLKAFIDSVSRLFAESRQWSALITLLTLGETHGREFTLSPDKLGSAALLLFLEEYAQDNDCSDCSNILEKIRDLRASVNQPRFFEPKRRSSPTVRPLSPTPRPNACGW